jgi:hypothetical protein
MWRKRICVPLSGFRAVMHGLIAGALVLGLASGWLMESSAAQTIPLPPGKNVELVANNCIVCHSLETVAQQRQNLAGWREIVDRMVGYGLEISPEEKQAILDYLATSLGP